MDAIDCSTVASVGEPTLTRNGVWMKDGTPALGAAGGEQRVLRGSPAVSRQPRGLPTNTCTAAGADRVGVGEAALGEAALDLDVRADRRAGSATSCTATGSTRIFTVVPCSTVSPAAGCCWRTLLPKNLGRRRP